MTHEPHTVLTAHWVCVYASPVVYWSLAICDWLITAAYLVIPLQLWTRAQHGSLVTMELSHDEARAMGLFIVSCGFTHLTAALTLHYAWAYDWQAGALWWCSVQSLFASLTLGFRPGGRCA